MSKNQKKSPLIEYFLADRLRKLEEKKSELESQLTINPHLIVVHELSLVNYHILCVENRINKTFTDLQAECEYAVTSTHASYTGRRDQ